MYASSVAFVRHVDHSSVILSCNLIGQQENRSSYVMEIVLRLGYADVIFRRRESRQPEIRLRSQGSFQPVAAFSMCSCISLSCIIYSIVSFIEVIGKLS